MKTITSENKLAQATKNYVEERYLHETPSYLVYHDFAHIMEVAETAAEIGKGCNLNHEDIEIIKIAAMFHDIGYLESCEKHEKNSADIAGHYLKTQGTAADTIEKVKGCILSTSIPQKPTNLLEEILCDADLIHLASSDYPKKAALLRKEWETASGYAFSDEEWQRKNIKFFDAHHFFTAYAKQHFEEGKRKNYEALLKSVNDPKKKKKENKKDKAGLSRGVETLFRTTSRNHISLSSIADTKANIMISVNSILLSILLTVLFRKFDEYPHLAFPTIIFCLVSLLTIIFAILATRPNITRGTFRKEDVNKKNTNLLFFGNFHNMPVQDYEWGMKEIIKNDDLIYGNMIRDIYYLGKVLGKKYQLLRISYTIFMYGLVVSISAFIFVFLYFYQNGNV
jgi:predicted metal-dependent HD superfamily phosphohydrolase